MPIYLLMNARQPSQNAHETPVRDADNPLNFYRGTGRYPERETPRVAVKRTVRVRRDFTFPQSAPRSGGAPGRAEGVRDWDGTGR